MVNRPGISIRRLMPHRRTGSEGSDQLDESSPDEYDLYLRGRDRPQHAHTWQAARTKGPPTPITIRKQSAFSRSMSPLPPLPTDPPGSASSSLSSLDGQSDTFWTANKKAAAVLGLPESAVVGGPPTTPRRPARPGNGYLGLKDSSMSPPPLPRAMKAMTLVESKRPLSPGGARPVSPRTLIDSSRSISPRPSVTTPDRARAGSPKLAASPRLTVAAPKEEPRAELPAELATLDQPSKPTEPVASQKHNGEWSDNVRQLIQETDLAFKAVGSALADAKLASYVFEHTNTSTPPPGPTSAPQIAPKELPPLPEASPDPAQADRPPSPLLAPAPAAVNTTHTNSTPLVPSPLKPSPVKVKAKKTKAKRNKGWPAMSSAMVARLGLSENVTDILTGQRFKRIEADEMLTPDQIKELKKIREEARRQANLLLQSRGSLDSDRGASKESVYELPAESEDLSVKQSESGTDEFDDEDEEDTCEEWDGKETGSDAGTLLTPPRWSVRNGSLTVSTRSASVSASPRSGSISASPRTCVAASPRSGSMSMSSVSARNASLSASTRLASISESANLIAEEPELEAEAEKEEEAETEEAMRRRKQMESLRSEEDDHFIYLKSTPFTLTTPTFKHGAITFSKADMSKLMMKVDDTLDWTAFQMAILGGAGDMMGGFYDEGEDYDSDAAEDMANWFDSFGFESAGALIDSSYRSGRESAGSMASSDSSVGQPSNADLDDMDLPIPLMSEHPSNIWNTAEAPYDTNKFFRSSGIRRWSGVPKRYGSQGEVQIPSDPIVVCGPEGDGDIEASVAGESMGYNLGDDLGDFLRWEAEQMCFYGAPRA
ncbi:hypothetical protein S7711_01160 [Stachybotrys chartarum IBT 7711]|uniref:Uncharacterized protein n=1 Tax=Stachybotrys chartarum (strain CBS 109288 / IBT 7711) TaxID=1280523 RepID=A0A084ASV4_STACB|nr:hypothetical protein S7711_01160 [Stachybotrys chartarum IBT 7711]KFA48952.1 hypothetical protein S40293_02529 [Stachybotrys chartarum IBT 40293]